MLQRKEIADAFRSALGREPEESAYPRCQSAFQNVQQLVEDLIASEEFKARSWHLAASKIRTMYLAVEENGARQVARHGL